MDVDIQLAINNAQSDREAVDLATIQYQRDTMRAKIAMFQATTSIKDKVDQAYSQIDKDFVDALILQLAPNYMKQNNSTLSESMQRDADRDSEYLMRAVSAVLDAKKAFYSGEPYARHS